LRSEAVFVTTTFSRAPAGFFDRDCFVALRFGILLPHHRAALHDSVHNQKVSR
jgi:hypothetical protein